MAGNLITDADITALLNLLQAPSYYSARKLPSPIKEGWEQDVCLKILVASFVLNDPFKREEVTKDDLLHFLHENPSPVEFQDKVDRFLNIMKFAFFSAESRPEDLSSVINNYRVELHNFAYYAYQKRQEYFDQILLLKQEANSRK